MSLRLGLSMYSDHVLRRYYKAGEYSRSQAIVSDLIKEVKRLDDKLLLVELHLVESQVQLKLSNVAKAKAALTSSRTAANAVFTPPLLQAKIGNQTPPLSTPRAQCT